MRYRSLAAISGLTVAGLATVAAAALSRLPAGTRLPTHWGADGLPDRFADAGYALFLPVVLAAAVSLVMAVLPGLEPLQRGMERSAPLYRTAWAGLLGLFGLVEATVAAPAFGFALPATAMLAGLGLLFMLLGNVLPKSRPGFFVGIRTPWAIIDPDNWVATHRFGGWIFMGAGLGLVILSALPVPAGDRASCVIALLLVTVATPVLYSFFLWRRATRG